MIPGSGGISRVTRLVGPHWGKWLAFGEEVSAELALTMGLVHAVYPAESFRERVTAFARKLAALPSEAAGVTKTAVDIAASVDRGHRPRLRPLREHRPAHLGRAPVEAGGVQEPQARGSAARDQAD